MPDAESKVRGQALQKDVIDYCRNRVSLQSLLLSDVAFKLDLTDHLEFRRRRDFSSSALPIVIAGGCAFTAASWAFTCGAGR